MIVLTHKVISRINVRITVILGRAIQLHWEQLEANEGIRDDIYQLPDYAYQQEDQA